MEDPGMEHVVESPPAGRGVLVVSYLLQTPLLLQPILI
jgi:hypothetical protein